MPNEPGRDDLLGRGIYTPAEAARLARIPMDTVRRWVRGYSYALRYRRPSTRKTQPPVVRPHLPLIEGRAALAFLDMIELLVVRALTKEGVPLQRIRRAAEEAREILCISHPFASLPIFTEGRHVFMQIEERAGLRGLMQMGRGGQWVLEAIMADYLHQIEFDPESRLAMRWWPLGKSGKVLIDPTVSFGAPIVESVGIRTTVLYQAVKLEQSADAVASWYEISADLVAAAVKFEESRIAA